MRKRRATTLVPDLLVVQDPVLLPLDIVVLVAFDRPHEEQPRPRTQDDRQEQEKDGRPHRQATSFRSRREFPTTTRELIAMSPADAMGCSLPVTASGIATAL